MFPRINSQLDLATSSFLSQEVSISKKENGSFEIRVSKLFLWYGRDFCGGDSQSDLLSWIISNLRPNKLNLEEIVAAGFEIIYRDYNWASNLLGEHTNTNNVTTY